MKEIEVRVYGQLLPTGEYLYSLTDKHGAVRVTSRNLDAIMGVYKTLSDYYSIRAICNLIVPRQKRQIRKKEVSDYDGIFGSYRKLD